MSLLFPERPRVASLDTSFLEDVRAAIADLPPQVWRLFDEQLIGLYFIEDLGGTGYSDAVLDSDKKPVAGFIVLDAAVLRKHTANAWATWKENTPFKPQERYKLEARIQADAHDNRKNAIQYILLHELGHVLAVRGDIHPLWNIEPKDVPASAKHDFFDLSWKIDRTANKYATLFDANFPQRKSVAYYFGAKLDATDMAPTYASLEKTNFPSLYAATNPGDDFAEAFASYIHGVLMQRPWEIRITRDGQPPMIVKSCWDAPRCASKRKVMEQILDRAR